MSTLPITRGVVFFSKTASMTLAGKSGKRYHFMNETETAAVINSIDIKFFRTHPQLREKGKPKATAAELAAKKRPVSYTEAGTRTKTFPPPSRDQLLRADRRRELFNDEKKKEAEGVSAKGIAKEGIGTKDAQERRRINAKISAGELSATIAPRADKDVLKKAAVKKAAAKKAPAKKVAPKLVEADPVETEAAEPVVKEAVKFQCEFCGRKLHNERGVRMHTNRWCKKNPDSPEYDPEL